jgi:magnesium transporter
VVLGGIAFANSFLLQSFGPAAATPEAAVGMGLRTAGVIAVAMAADVVFAAILGVSVPYFVKLLRIDPALISTPAVTALTDLTGASIFLLLVTVLL